MNRKKLLCALVAAQEAQKNTLAKPGNVVQGRASVGFTLPLLEWCDIPEGYVIIEKQKIFVPAFRMAKYPVTYGQFQAFIYAPDGYQNGEWWEGIARREHTPEEQIWKIDNHPRENVNWYEAMAFARWLAFKTGLPITLPTESQWQRAAQGSDGREYPWGNEFDKDKCNTWESGIGRTTLVDKYPNGVSPFGVMDMSGNVWEWCLNEYRSSEVNIGSSTARGLRGGSWYFNRGFACAASRFVGEPGSPFDFIGFRLVVGRAVSPPASGGADRAEHIRAVADRMQNETGDTVVPGAMRKIAAWMLNPDMDLLGTMLHEWADR